MAPPGEREAHRLSSGFRTVYRSRSGGRRFAELLDRVAAAAPGVRLRFTSPHPKDFPDEVRGGGDAKGSGEGREASGHLGRFHETDSAADS